MADTAQFADEAPKAEFDTAQFADEPKKQPEPIIERRQPLTLPGKIVAAGTSFLDQTEGNLKEYNRKNKEERKKGNYTPLKPIWDMPPSTAWALADLITGTVGLPMSWMNANQEYKFTGDKAKALSALETTKEWTSARHIAKHYLKEFGVDEKDIDRHLHSDNMIDSIFKVIDQGLEKGVDAMGIKDPLGRHAAKDLTMILAPIAAGKVLSKKAPRTTPEKDVAEIKAEKEAQVRKESMQDAVQEEMFPVKGEQAEMQFGKAPEAKFADEFVPEREVIDQEFSSRQNELPLEGSKDLITDADTVQPRLGEVYREPIFEYPFKDDLPSQRENWTRQPAEAPTSNKEIFPTPGTIGLTKDVNTSAAKNPFLDETTIRQAPEGLEFDKLPPNEVQPLPNIGTINDATGGLEQAGLPFRTTGQLWTPEGKRVPLGQIKKSQGGWVKLPGGNWDPQIYKDFLTFLAPIGRLGSIKGDIERISKHYIDKYLGTERDPLKDTVITVGGEQARWEDLTDNLILKRNAIEYSKQYGHMLEGDLEYIRPEYLPLRDLAKLGREKPQEPVYITKDYSNRFFDFLEHVRDYITNHIPPEQLPRWDFPRIVRAVVEQDARQAKAMAKARGSGEGVTTYKEYPDGMKWVEVGKGTINEKDLNQFKITIDWDGFASAQKVTKDKRIFYDLGDVGSLRRSGLSENDIQLTLRKDLEKLLLKEQAEQALKSEGDVMGHCVGGYCEQVSRGDSRIFSLRDKNNNSHVTIEVINPKKALLNSDRADYLLSNEEQIIQIKGKQNAKPVEKYIPYVQDFVKTSKMEVVRDLENTDMFTIHNWPEEISLNREKVDRYLGLNPEALQKYLPDTGPYYTKAEMIEAAEKWYNDHGTKYFRTFGGLSPDEAAKVKNLLPKVFVSTPEAVRDKINTLISPHSSQKEIIAEAKSGLIPKETDFNYVDVFHANSITKNQVPPVIKKPSVVYHVGKVRDANIEKATLAHELAAKVEELEAAPLNTRVRAMAALTELQKQKYQDWGKKTGKSVTDADLAKLGLSPEEIASVRVIRKINDRLWEITKEARLRLDGKDMGASPVWEYHPRSYGIGDHALVLYDKQTNEVVFHHKYQKYDEMAVDYRKLEEAIKDDPTFGLAYRAGSKEWDNPFTNIDMSTVPKVIQDILANIETKIETRQRTFEIDRVQHDIKGLVQYLADGKPDPMLWDIWISHIKNVIEFDRKSRIFEAQKELLDNAEYFNDKPLMRDWIQKMLQQELGHDIAWLPFRAVAKMSDSVVNIYDRLKHKALGKDLIDKDGKDVVITKEVSRDMARFSSATASSFTLLANINNAFTNATHMPLTTVVGLPLDVLGRLRASPRQTLEWTVQLNLEGMQILNELAYTISTGNPTRSSVVLDNYSKKGQVKSHMFDEISEVAEDTNPSFRREVAKATNVARKWTNDLFIESPTNAWSLLIYDRLVHDIAKDHLAKAGLTRKQREELPIVLAKSWTAEYNKWAKPMYLQKMGIVGDVTGNFINWPANQWGRFLEAMSELKPEKGKALYTQLGFITAMYLMYNYLAGGKNAPIAATWDYFRQWYNNEWKDKDEDSLPDLDYYALELGLPRPVYNMDPLLDKTGIDLASSQKFASPIQIATITPQFFWSLAKSTKLGMEMLSDNLGLWESNPKDTSPEGVTRSRILSDTSKLPSIIRHGYIEPKVATFDRDDGKKSIVNRFDKLNYTQEPEEKWLNDLGVKSVRQRKESTEIQHHRVTKERLAKEPERLKEHIIQQLTDYLTHDQDGFTTEAIIMENIMRMDTIDPQWTKTLKKDLKTRRNRMLNLPKEEIIEEAKHTKKAAKLKRLITMYDRLSDD